MYYKCEKGRLQGWFETSDGVVVRASETFEWAIGEKISVPLKWCRNKYANVHVAQFAPDSYEPA